MPCRPSGYCQDSHRPATQAGVTSPGTHRPRVPVLHAGYMLCQTFSSSTFIRPLKFTVAAVPAPVYPRLAKRRNECADRA